MSEANDGVKPDTSSIDQQPRPFDPILEMTGVDEFVVAGVAGWTTTMERALDDSGRVAIGVNRTLTRRLTWSKNHTSLHARKVRRVLVSLGIHISEQYAVWPSLEAPRLIYRSPVTGWWLQRAGIIGGGGQSGLRQRVARSLLAAPIVTLAYPSSIWVVVR